MIKYNWFSSSSGVLPQPANPWLPSLVSHKDILHFRGALPWSEPYPNSSFLSFTQPNFFSLSELRRTLLWSEPYPNSGFSAFRILILRDPHIPGSCPSHSNTHSFISPPLCKKRGNTKYTHMQHFHFTPPDSFQARTKHSFVQHTPKTL